MEKKASGLPLISHADGVKITLRLLCLGKSDFEARAEIACDDPKNSPNQGIGEPKMGSESLLVSPASQISLI